MSRLMHIARRAMVPISGGGGGDSYQLINYLETDGIAYIDLGFPAFQPFYMECEAMATQSSGEQFLWGARSSGNNRHFFGWDGGSDPLYKILWEPTFLYRTYSFPTDAWQKSIISINSDGSGYFTRVAGKYSQQTQAIQGNNPIVANNHLFLFAANDSGQVANKCASGTRLKRIFFSNDTADPLNHKILDLRPCIKNGVEFGMVDVLTNTFYGNAAASGAFTGDAPTGLLTDYIQDSLVFWLDGKEKGNVAGTWKDLIGSNDYVSAGDVEILNDGVYFKGSGASYMSCSTGTSWATKNPSNVRRTIEMCCRFDGGQNNTEVVFIQSDSGFAFGRTNNLYILSSSNYNAYTNSNGYAPLALSLSQTSENGCFLNGRQCPLASNNYFDGGQSPFLLGRRHGSANYFKGTIHAIRIHNRPLTTFEMSHNQWVDNVRFNLGFD